MHQRDGHADAGLRCAAAWTGLQNEQLAVLDRELDILYAKNHTHTHTSNENKYHIRHHFKYQYIAQDKLMF